MPHSRGYKSGTRHKFSKAFRGHGTPGVSIYLQPLRIGDYVDIKADTAVQKGMPFHRFHGLTGIIFDLRTNGVGIRVNHRRQNSIKQKFIYVRREHVRLSRCREEFERRIARAAASREAGETVVGAGPSQNVPGQPKPACIVQTSGICDLTPLEFVDKVF